MAANSAATRQHRSRGAVLCMAAYTLIALVSAISLCHGQTITRGYSIQAHFDPSIRSGFARTLASSKSKPPVRGKQSTSQGQGFLQEAIASANESPGRPTKVVLTADVSLTEDLPKLQYNARLELRGNCGRNRCVIKGGGVKGFDCAPGASLLLEDVELTGFGAGAVVGECSGVGVDTPLIARRVTFSGNSNTRGGAIQQGMSVIQLSSCLFEDNEADQDGGAVALERGGSLSVFNCSFQGNEAKAGSGGALAGQVDLVQRTEFSGNRAQKHGGAVYSNAIGGRAPTFIRSSFEGNKANAGGGGAIALTVEGGGTTTSFQSRVCQSTFAGNSAASPAASDGVWAMGVDGISSVVRVCGGDTSAVTADQTGVKVVSSCVGCTACGPSDCNNNGKCVASRLDGTAQCQCSGNFDASVACATCTTGYSPIGGCTKCIMGYISTPGPTTTAAATSKRSRARHPTTTAASTSSGQCTACPALDSLPDVNVYRIIGGARVASQDDCAALCAASRSIPTYDGDRAACQNWIWMGRPAAAAVAAAKAKGKKGLAAKVAVGDACAGLCVMRDVEGACSNSTSKVMNAGTFPYYMGYFDDGTCGPA
eukprot:TRINITY_DN14509_c0_g1_i1.p1 TRINITY_DN14509_c0_g1~~TRINITY_DN14509_c0_g1_i1.p1  ORF type:complete len:596 (+),score=17.56 TRINITY_DN14509_c0_g1_i1:101-1888(+)